MLKKLIINFIFSLLLMGGSYETIDLIGPEIVNPIIAMTQMHNNG